MPPGVANKKQERPRAPVVKLSCLQEHVHKKKVLEIVSHHSKYNIFKARNSCIVPGGFSMPLVALSIGTHVTLAKLYKLADPHMHVKSPGNSRRSRKRYEDILTNSCLIFKSPGYDFSNFITLLTAKMSYLNEGEVAHILAYQPSRLYVIISGWPASR